MEPPWLIVTALGEELGPLLRRLQGARRCLAGFAGLLGARRVRLACTGPGAERATRGLDRLLADGPSSLVIGAGVAGALSDRLAVGDVIVGVDVCDRLGQRPASDELWRGRAERLGARPAVAFTVDHIVTHPAERLALADELPADALACVDMESAPWVSLAQRRGLPCLILRVISDGSAEALPAHLAGCLDRQGAISRARVVARSLVRPGSWPRLLRLRRQTRQAATRLSIFIERLSLEES